MTSEDLWTFGSGSQSQSSESYGPPSLNQLLNQFNIPGALKEYPEHRQVIFSDKRLQDTSYLFQTTAMVLKERASSYRRLVAGSKDPDDK